MDVVAARDRLIRAIKEFGFDGVTAVGRSLDIERNFLRSRCGWEFLVFALHCQADSLHEDLLELRFRTAEKQVGFWAC
jgi:hypothetical protein